MSSGANSRCRRARAPGRDQPVPRGSDFETEMSGNCSRALAPSRSSAGEARLPTPLDVRNGALGTTPVGASVEGCGKREVPHSSRRRARVNMVSANASCRRALLIAAGRSDGTCRSAPRRRFEHRRLDATAIDVRSVQAPRSRIEGVAVTHELGVATRDGDVVEEDLAPESVRSWVRRRSAERPPFRTAARSATSEPRSRATREGRPVAVVVHVKLMVVSEPASVARRAPQREQ